VESHPATLRPRRDHALAALRIGRPAVPPRVFTQLFAEKAHDEDFSVIVRSIDYYSAFGLAFQVAAGYARAVQRAKARVSRRFAAAQSRPTGFPSRVRQRGAVVGPPAIHSVVGRQFLIVAQKSAGSFSSSEYQDRGISIATRTWQRNRRSSSPKIPRGESGPRA
jgi:hypothetical protein